MDVDGRLRAAATPPIVRAVTAYVKKLSAEVSPRALLSFLGQTRASHLGVFKFFILLMVDRTIAIGYTPFSATRCKHFPTTRDGLDANSR
jgi:hypothetical protein